MTKKNSILNIGIILLFYYLDLRYNVLYLFTNKMFSNLTTSFKPRPSSALKQKIFLIVDIECQTGWEHSELVT